MEEADADLDADLQDAQELEDIAACAQIGMQLRQRVILHIDCDEFFLQVSVRACATGTSPMGHGH